LSVAVIHDRDLYELARLLIETRGADAELFATAKLQEACDTGNDESCVVWTLLVEALKDLSRTTRQFDEPLN
jgi:hypothetical protein